MRYKNKEDREKAQNSGFTLLELMVVIAIIGLLASIALIALQSARAKSRDAKRLADMTQMNTGLQLYFADFKGYPSTTAGLPQALVPTYASSLPSNPQPTDGSCTATNYPSPPTPVGSNGSNYYYFASGTAYLGADNTTMVYPDYAYFFCLGNQAGDFPAGLHVLTPEGVQ